MSHVIALMLKIVQLLDPRLYVLVLAQRGLQQLGAFYDVAAHFGEHVEEFLFSGDQANHAQLLASPAGDFELINISHGVAQRLVIARQTTGAAASAIVPSHHGIMFAAISRSSAQ